jgi:hypothetical protein
MSKIYPPSEKWSVRDPDGQNGFVKKNCLD